MKRLFVIALFVVVAAAGCQQREKQQAPASHPGGAVMMKPPWEISQMEQLAKASPKNVNGWIALGNALMDAQRFGEAVDAYQKALVLDPKNVDVRVDMGTCYRGIGRSDRAIEEYRKGIKINPSHLNAHRNSGVVLAFDLNDKKGAIKAFEKYLELAPAAPDAAQIRDVIAQLQAGK